MKSAIKVFRPKQADHKSDLWHAIGLPRRGPQLHEALRNGVAYEVYSMLASFTGLGKQDLARFVAISPTTLRRRATTGRFTVDEGDRLYRVAEVYHCAIDLFEGDTQQTNQWLLTPAPGLGNTRPVDMVVTSAGTAAVLNLIGRLEHGVCV